MEDKIFEMVIESMKQKLIFSDMVEMRKIIKGAVRMMEAHYEAKMPSDEAIEKWAFQTYHELGDARLYEPLIMCANWLKSQLTDKLQEDIKLDYSREDGK